MGTNHAEHQVVVVGARCAGAATALLLARQGVDVLVVDRATMPSDTLSTHAIARGGVVQLARWGLLEAVVASGAPEIRRVSFHTGDGGVIEKEIKHAAGVDHLLAPRRHVLDPILVDAAHAAGAAVRSGVTVTGVVRDGDGRVTGVVGHDTAGDPVVVEADVVVGADGLRSKVARAVGSPVVEAHESNLAIHYAYVAGLGAEGFEYHLGDRRFAGVFPTHGGEACVWAITTVDDARRLRTTPGPKGDAFVELLAAVSPALAGRVAAAGPTSGVRGAVRLPNQRRRPVGPGWALVGDAAYHRDAITGHGITDAFRGAELLAVELARGLRAGDVDGALATYAAEHERTLRPVLDLTLQLVQLPPVAEFTELQRRLSRCIEAEASWLAGLPPVVAPAPAAA